MIDDLRMQNILKTASESEKKIILQVANIALEAQKDAMQKFHVSAEELAAIASGDLIVDCVITHPLHDATKSNRHTSKTRSRTRQSHGFSGHLKRIAQLVTFALLALCVFVPGFADNIRGAFLLTAGNVVSTNVSMISYDKYGEDIAGSALPVYMVDGFEYKRHTKLSNLGAKYVLYKNQDGDSIEYYYYPLSAEASYDIESSEFHTLNTSKGIVYVGYMNEETTILYFLYGEAYIQIDFSFIVDDDVCRQIAENVRGIN